MNKYEEALSYFEMEDGEDVTVTIDWYENWLILRELVQKETPLKPIWKLAGVTSQRYYVPHCPTCDNAVTFGRCCGNNDCRQKLDWSEGNE